MNNTEQPLVSVIMPTYNHAKFISKAIESVLSQTYRNLELIIIDNYSEDNTEKIVASYKDNRVKYMKFRNNGIIAASRNVGIKHSKGEYIAFLDSDDLWMPQKLGSQLKIMETNKDIGLIFSNFIRFSNGQDCGLAIRRKLNPLINLNRLMISNCIACSTVMIRRKYTEEIGIFDENPNLKAIEDYELWIRIAYLFKVYYLDLVLSKYRIHSENISGTIMDEEERLTYMFEKLKDKIGIKKCKVKTVLAMQRARCGLVLIKHREYKDFLMLTKQIIKRGIKSNPPHH